MTLKEEYAVKVISQDGAVQRHLPQFEIRTQQQDMLKAVVRCYNEACIGLIEAGTGTGKSMAYLIPAILWAIQKKEITVISTNTIALQEQLLHKDIPLLIKALNVEVKAVLVKGMRNYLCLRKLEDAKSELPLLPPEECHELQKIEAWSQSTVEGCRSDLSFSPSFASWDRVSAESDNCTREQCAYVKECFFFKARKEAQEAQILIVNHHLLFTDIARRIENESTPGGQNIGILPQYYRTILDEAHNLEDIATDYLAQHINLLEVMRLFGLLATDSQYRSYGKLPLLRTKLEQIYRKSPPHAIAMIIQRIQLDLMAQRKALQDLFYDTFECFRFFAQTQNCANEESKESLRIHAEHLQTPYWQETILPKTQRLEEEARRFFQALYSVTKDLEECEDTRVQEQTKSMRVEINALRARLEKALFLIITFATTPPVPEKVRWIELQSTRSITNVQLINADLDVSKILARHFFERFNTSILCSATLTTNREFQFLRSRLGIVPALLPEHKITESIYDSPFNYAKQSMLIVPNDLPAPQSPNFTDEACKAILTIVQASRGNAFVLFTSYSMLRQCFDKLKETLIDDRFYPCKQGDAPRQALLQQFKDKDRSILFGTDSFWEGVDVAGEALRCVIIVKLPFRVPTEPIVEARTEAITARGGSAFYEYSVPNAIVKFKQGFGRLIRHNKDRGCVVCLDTRLIQKNYGKLFINSLPPSQLAIIETKELKPVMEKFFRETYKHCK